MRKITDIRENKCYKKAMVYILVGVSCGVVCGGTCVLFAWLTSICDMTFQIHSKLLFLLPLVGLIVVYLYDGYRKNDDLSMNALYRHMRENKPISPWVIPLVALSTCLAYLTGGSVGRVGPALQIGGGLSVVLAEKLNKKLLKYVDSKLLLVCGISAGICGILNTPIAAAVFGVEVLILFDEKKEYILPALISSVVTWGIAELTNVRYVDFHGHISGLELNMYMLIKVLVVCFAAMLAGRLFCSMRKATAKLFGYIKNKYARVLVGTGLVIGATLILGDTSYNGIGFTFVAAALDGHSAMLAFFWKLLLTSFTLGCGIRGGEIAPTIFVGATGCFAVGTIIGFDPGISAAIGIVGALASVTNCPVAIFIYGLEGICFSWEMTICFAMASVVAHCFSGTGGLYSEQHPELRTLKLF